MTKLMFSPRGSIYLDSARAFEKILDQKYNVVVWSRGCPRFLDAWLMDVRLPRVPSLELFISIHNLPEFESKLDQLVRRMAKGYPDVNAWFVGDVVEHLNRFFKIVGAEQVRLKLGESPAISGRYLGIGKPLKLLCSYGGAGVKWLPAESAGDEVVLGKEVEAIKARAMKVDPLDVVILKGAAWPGNELGHAYYALEPSRKTRSLLLEIDYLF